eukprot:4524423-Amphidinium_carterae.1
MEAACVIAEKELELRKQVTGKTKDRVQGRGWVLFKVWSAMEWVCVFQSKESKQYAEEAARLGRERDELERKVAGARREVADLQATLLNTPARLASR